VVTISFLSLLNAITAAGTFFVFAFFTLVAIAYMWRRVPETKGMRLEEISAQAERRRPIPEMVPAQAARRATAPAPPHRHASR
jgi:hypothetical protein